MQNHELTLRGRNPVPVRGAGLLTLEDRHQPEGGFLGKCFGDQDTGGEAFIYSTSAVLSRLPCNIAHRACHLARMLQKSRNDPDYFLLADE